MKTAMMIVAGAMLLGGCVTKEECASVDWYGLGVEDGERGGSVDGGDSERYFTSCTRLGALVDESAYDRGFAEGYALFCNADWTLRGQREGLAGRPARDMTRTSSACAMVNASVDADGYISGYQAGATSYCEDIDWYELGAQAARDGERNARAETPEACGIVGIRADARAFDRGYESEVDALCSESAAFKAGLEGDDLNPVCRGSYGVRDAFEDGERARELEQDLKALNDERRAIKDRGRNPAQREAATQALAEIKARIDALESEIFNLRHW